MKFDTFPNELEQLSGILKKLDISGNTFSSKTLEEIKSILPNTEIIY